MEMLQAKIRITRSGVYLLLFSLALLQSSFYTGTNILFLLDFFLIALLLFNYLYLRRLRNLSLIPLWPECCEEDTLIKVPVKFQGGLPFAGRFELDWMRFGKLYSQKASAICWGTQNCLWLDAFPIRGKYELSQIKIEIDYPLKLFVLKASMSQSMVLRVHPKPFSEKNLEMDFSEGRGSGNQEFSGLRLWRPGDGVRNIAWKHYARTGIMQVKSWEVGEDIAQAYILKWDETDEKKYFQEMAALMIHWIQRQIAFKIHGKGGGFDSSTGNEKDLLDYLAVYETGEQK
ncbi:MAG: DUF58 domain-containing protein [Candidatus Cloacimonetes bacterium]|nr:DUF58 domain-containing protein [Candidatus Cloacimonadota bacterium]